MKVLKFSDSHHSCSYALLLTRPAYISTAKVGIGQLSTIA